MPSPCAVLASKYRSIRSDGAKAYGVGGGSRRIHPLARMLPPILTVAKVVPNEREATIKMIRGSLKLLLDTFDGCDCDSSHLFTIGGYMIIILQSFQSWQGSCIAKLL